jgi:hypothetical protein
VRYLRLVGQPLLKCILVRLFSLNLYSRYE